MSDLAILIPYYNGFDYIERCLDSLEAYPQNDIYLVDNGSIPYAGEFQGQIINTKEKHLGFAKAVNKGLDIIYKKEYTKVLILNQDAFFAPGHFSKLIKFLGESPIKKIISPIIYTEDLKEVMPFIQYRYFKSREFKEVMECEDFVAVSWVIPISILKKLNGFDEAYHMYYEDNDFLKRTGLKFPVKVLTNVIVGHRNEELNGKEMSNEKRKWLDESQLRFYKIHKSKPQWLFLRLRIGVRNLFRN